VQPMDKKIQSVVKLFHYPMWFIKLNQKVQCPCVDHTTRQARPDCKLCLGTGKKIHLIRAKAARQTTESVSMRGEGLGYSEKNAAERFFTLQNLELHEGDIIVDNGNVNIVQYYMPGRTDKTSAVYFRTVATRMKTNVNQFLESFQDLLRRNGYG